MTTARIYEIDKLIITFVVLGEITVPRTETGTGTGTGVGASPIGSQAQSRKEYECKNGKKLSWFHVCDGKKHCYDGSEELNCTTCSGFEETFHCDSGQCILQSQFCNEHNDCKDGSDEKFNCSGTIIIPPQEVPDVNNSETQSSSTGTIVLATMIPVVIIVLVAIVILMYIFRSKIPYRRYIRVCSKPRISKQKIPGEVLPLLEVSKLVLSPPQQQDTSNNDIPMTQTVFAQTSYKLLTDKFVSVLEKVGDVPFAVICMSGMSRIGKSYLLNFFMQNLSESLPAEQYERNQPHQIFKWKKGTAAQTVGIDIWSEPFFKFLPDGRQIAILLMDSEGLFGDEREMEENSVVFALSNILSSILMVNCRFETLTATLQHIYSFSNYARSIDIGGGANNVQPPQEGQPQGQGRGSQKLVIMVRDFVNHDEFSYGYHDQENAPANSPRNFYMTKFNNERLISPELPQGMNEFIQNYESIGFTLFPDPGEKFRRDPLRNSPVPEFIRVRDEAVQLLLCSEHPVTKKLLGKEVSGNEFISFVRELDIIFKKEINKFPHQNNFKDFIVEISYSLAYKAGHAYFIQNLECALKNSGNGTDTDIDDELELKFNQIREEAVVRFTSYTQLTIENKAKEFEERLREECKITFEKMKADNRKVRTLTRNSRSVVEGSVSHVSN